MKKRKPCLYDRIWDVEKEIEQQNMQKNASHVPLYRNIFEEFSQNPILSEALAGRKTVENSYYEIRKRSRPFLGVFVPRTKDEELNSSVDSLSELVARWDMHEFKRLGLLEPGNMLVHLVGWTNLASLALLTFAGVQKIDNLDVSLMNYGSSVMKYFVENDNIPITAGLSMTYLHGALQASLIGLPKYHERAKFIDKTIEILYKGESK